VVQVALGCVEFAVPGDGLQEKLEVLERRGMWLELANDGNKRVGEVRELLATHSVPVRSVQAYRQHEFQLLAPERGERELARRHVEETIRMAAELGAKNTVVVICYGTPGVKAPRKACLGLFRDFGALGEELGTLISIESLGTKTSFLPTASEVHWLIREVASENLRLLIDTMHIWSCGEDPARVIETYALEAGEVQLRDTGSRPPGRGEMDFTPILGSLRGFGGLVCLEYRPGRNPLADFELACKTCGVIGGG
jgi:sugar phosphate isomerase/epimerase